MSRLTAASFQPKPHIARFHIGLDRLRQFPTLKTPEGAHIGTLSHADDSASSFVVLDVGRGLIQFGPVLEPTTEHFRGRYLDQDLPALSQALDAWPLTEPFQMQLRAETHQSGWRAAAALFATAESIWGGPRGGHLECDARHLTGETQVATLRYTYRIPSNALSLAFHYCGNIYRDEDASGTAGVPWRIAPATMNTWITFEPNEALMLQGAFVFSDFLSTMEHCVAEWNEHTDRLVTIVPETRHNLLVHDDVRDAQLASTYETLWLTNEGEYRGDVSDATD